VGRWRRVGGDCRSRSSWCRQAVHATGRVRWQCVLLGRGIVGMAE
jgi:hypothetical protein